MNKKMPWAKNGLLSWEGTMKLGFDLRLEQAQKLIITPQLQQAVALLQYSSMELLDYIQKELVDNPLLELEERLDPGQKQKEKDKGESQEEVQWEDYFQDYEDYGFKTKEHDQEHPSLESNASRPFSLQEHLLFQLQLTHLSATEYAIGEFLIGNIDRNGYLQGSLEELAGTLGVKQEELLAVLEQIQQFEPLGVGARSIEECLWLQAVKREDRPPFAEEIIKHFLPDVAEGHYHKIARKLGCEPVAVQEAVDFIRTLEPKPGSFLGDNNDTRYITPDIIVQKVGSDYVVLVNDNLSPYLKVNSYYQSLLKSGGMQASAFLKDRLDRALWLIRSIEQRRLTLYRVAEQIVKMQRNFLEEGIKHLQPMTLKDVAEAIGMHESTVSRATANKYVQTPRGLFPFKFFFSSGVSDGQGGRCSTRVIKKMIKELIEKENPQRPYSDQKLVEALREHEVVLSRRTVAKYREEMNIPGSHKRRRL
jgi:RNA polymerase sigma-54 factor